jgi:hypothetical protein
MAEHRLRILFVTNSEHGQANAVFAIAHELLIRGDVDVHLASFADLAPRIDQVNSRAKHAAPDTATSLHVHWLSAESMYQKYLTRPDINGSHETAVASLLHEPGFRGVWRGYGVVSDVLLCWTADEYMAVIDDVKRLQKELEPDQIVVDSGLAQGIEGAILAGAEWMMLSPNSFKDLAGPYQPNGAALWKLPT